MSSRTQRITEVFKRGDQYVQDYHFTCPNLDFAGVNITAQVRETEDGPLLASATVTKVTVSTGTCAGQIIMGDSITRTLPPRCVMEVSLHHPGASWGPHTPVEIWLKVSRDYNRS